MDATRLLRWALLLTVACGSKASVTNPPVRMAAIIDVSGSEAAPSRISAIQLAVSDFNAALKQSGSFKADSFEILTTDSTNNPVVAVPAAISFVYDAGVRALMTDTSNDTNSINYLNYDGGTPLNVPVMGVECTSNNLNNPDYVTPDGGDPAQTLAYHNTQGWLFRTTANNNLESSIMLRIIQGYSKNGDGDVNGDGKFQVSMLGTQEPYGLGFLSSWTTLLHSTTPDAGLETLEMPYDVSLASYNWTDLATWMDDNLNETPCSPCSLTDCTCENGNAPISGFGYPDAIWAALYSGFVAEVFPAITAQPGTIVLNTHGAHFNSVLNTLGTKFDGAEGVSFQVVQDNDSGSVFASELLASSGFPPDQWDGQAYDGAVLLMLATVYAAVDNGLSSLSQVTPSMIREGLTQINNQGSNAVIVRTGPAALANGITELVAKTPINYDGASSPCDFDANQNVNNRFAHFHVINQAFVDGELFDCVADPTTCPCVPANGYSCP